MASKAIHYHVCNCGEMTPCARLVRHECQRCSKIITALPVFTHEEALVLQVEKRRELLARNCPECQIPRCNPDCGMPHAEESKCTSCGQDDDLKLTFCSKCRVDYCNRCISAHEATCEETNSQSDGIKDGETVCEHSNRPFDCPTCRRVRSRILFDTIRAVYDLSNRQEQTKSSRQIPKESD
jgi:hypothetical protein